MMSRYGMTLLHGERKFLFLFALYGLAVGIISYVSSLSYDDHFLNGIASLLNYPTVMLILFSNPDGLSIPISVYPIVIILSSTAVWSFIGFIVYLFIKLFRL